MRYGSESEIDRELEAALAELEDELAAQEAELAQEAEEEQRGLLSGRDKRIGKRVYPLL